MISQAQVATRPTVAHAETTEEAIAVIERHNFRARFWRLAVGAVGLFWVCALLALMR